VDAAGSRVVFSSTSDLVPGANADLNMEIFMFDVDAGTLTQITSTTGGHGCAGPAISANGMVVAFSCDRDLVPGSNTDLNGEVFLAKLKH
jgi:Tol biopolymer transport system component